MPFLLPEVQVRHSSDCFDVSTSNYWVNAIKSFEPWVWKQSEAEGSAFVDSNSMRAHGDVMGNDGKASYMRRNGYESYAD